MEIKTLYGNIPCDQAYVEDIYDSLEQAQNEHPEELIVVGYCIVDATTNQIVPGSNDWYTTYSEAKDELRCLENANP